MVLSSGCWLINFCLLSSQTVLENLLNSMLYLCAEEDILRNKITCLKLCIHSYMKTIGNYLIELIDRF